MSDQPFVSRVSTSPMTTLARNRRNQARSEEEDIAPTASTSTPSSPASTISSSSTATTITGTEPSTAVLDHTAYPHIFDLILDHCSPLALGRVRGTSRENYHMTNALRYGHVTVWRGPVSNYTSAPRSLEAFGWDANDEDADAQNGDAANVQPNWGYSTRVHPNTLGAEDLKIRMLDVIGWRLDPPSSSPIPSLNYSQLHTVRLFKSTARTPSNAPEQFCRILRPRRLIVDATADTVPSGRVFSPWFFVPSIQRMVMNYNYGTEKGYTALATAPRLVPRATGPLCEFRDLVIVLHPHACPAPLFNPAIGPHCGCPKPASMSLIPVADAMRRALLKGTPFRVTLVGVTEIPFHWLELGFTWSPYPLEIKDQLISLALQLASAMTGGAINQNLMWTIAAKALSLETFAEWRALVGPEFRAETMQW